MIKLVNDDWDAVIDLWQEAFGDSREDVLFFINNCQHKDCLAYYNNNQFASMLFLVDCICDGKKGKYIYAACTNSKYRSQGFMSQLLDYCKQNYSLICLIPANSSLVDYYLKREIDVKFSLDKLAFDEDDKIKEYLFEGCELKKPFALAYYGG